MRDDAAALRTSLIRHLELLRIRVKDVIIVPLPSYSSASLSGGGPDDIGGAVLEEDAEIGDDAEYALSRELSYEVTRHNVAELPRPIPPRKPRPAAPLTAATGAAGPSIRPSGSLAAESSWSSMAPVESVGSVEETTSESSEHEAKKMAHGSRRELGGSNRANGDKERSLLLPKDTMREYDHVDDEIDEEELDDSDLEGLSVSAPAEAGRHRRPSLSGVKFSNKSSGILEHRTTDDVGDNDDGDDVEGSSPVVENRHREPLHVKFQLGGAGGRAADDSRKGLHIRRGSLDSSLDTKADKANAKSARSKRRRANFQHARMVAALRHEIRRYSINSALLLLNLPPPDLDKQVMRSKAAERRAAMYMDLVEKLTEDIPRAVLVHTGERARDALSLSNL